MSEAGSEQEHIYVIYGRGGLSTVQARLAEHGLCSYTCWVPCPPDWRFRFHTPLTAEAVTYLLEDILLRYSIRFSTAGTVYVVEPENTS